MSPIFKKHGAIIISVITAIAIIVTAYLTKDSDYENSWFIILAVGSVLAGFFELYSKMKEKDKHKESQ